MRFQFSVQPTQIPVKPVARPVFPAREYFIEGHAENGRWVGAVAKYTYTGTEFNPMIQNTDLHRLNLSSLHDVPGIPQKFDAVFLFGERNQETMRKRTLALARMKLKDDMVGTIFLVGALTHQEEMKGMLRDAGVAETDIVKTGVSDNTLDKVSATLRQVNMLPTTAIRIGMMVAVYDAERARRDWKELRRREAPGREIDLTILSTQDELGRIGTAVKQILAAANPMVAQIYARHRKIFKLTESEIRRGQAKLAAKISGA